MGITGSSTWSSHFTCMRALLASSAGTVNAHLVKRRRCACRHEIVLQLVHSHHMHAFNWTDPSAQTRGPIPALQA